MTTEQNKPELPAPIPGSNSYLERLNHFLALSFSVPERAARAAAAIVGGGTQLLSRTLIPNSLKSTNSYRFTLGMFQTFLIKNVAGIDHGDSEIELKDEFTQRKLLGTSLEAAGLLTMHLSPVWVFAIASDAAKGGQVFLKRLVTHLKENQVIAQDSYPGDIEQLLSAIQNMGQQSATAFDTPPMSREEVRQLAEELRQSTASLALNSSRLIPHFESIWDQITEVAKKESLSVEQVMGILSVRAAAVADISRGTVDAVGKTGAFIVDEMILKDYKQTLVEIGETGSLTYLQTHMQPFVLNARSHFDFGRETASQRWFKGALARFISKLKPHS